MTGAGWQPIPDDLQWLRQARRKSVNDRDLISVDMKLDKGWLALEASGTALADPRLVR